MEFKGEHSILRDKSNLLTWTRGERTKRAFHEKDDKISPHFLSEMIRKIKSSRKTIKRPHGSQASLDIYHYSEIISLLLTYSYFQIEKNITSLITGGRLSVDNNPNSLPARLPKIISNIPYSV
ncbi:MAG: hypothetical protein J7L26_03705, partial [Candidatus Aminicenantes bacterium]|nr:hypothetical protein [Candidatus Aminicenantes bacterium]